jgi:hypothetical protein
MSKALAAGNGKSCQPILPAGIQEMMSAPVLSDDQIENCAEDRNANDGSEKAVIKAFE